MDFDRLLKLLNLTRSDNDHEALLAIRQANKLMDDHNLSWDNCMMEVTPRRTETPRPSPRQDHTWAGGDITKEEFEKFKKAWKWTFR